MPYYRPLITCPDDENEFSYIKGSDKGPEHWGELHKEWAACGNGKLQSPIDLSNKIVKITSELGMLKTCYKPFDATLKNEGHVIMLQWNGDAGFLEINGTKYFLKQIHWHHPSEHVINGLRFDLEAHLVHASANNEKAVLAVMYKLGAPDSLLSELEGQIRHLSADNKTEANVGAIDPSHVKIGGWKYYRYSGSLTTPPCTEGVIWTINEQVYIYEHIV
ncbi:hypothetical protein Syun_000724 [Stephania yunnanensis]|uniref:Carbonic anhydrase n=1 Tax=Stephania yunnanensis TaxID=152371 RepID=A0AAP0LGH6_9MAGN